MISDETRSAGPGVLGGVVILDPVTRKPIPAGRITLIDPETGQPYKAGVTVQQVEGGFDPTGLSTEQKQDAILSALQELIAAFQATGPQEVYVTDDALPPVEGQATATKQDQILAALNTLLSLATEAATFRDSGVQAVSLESTPLPLGAASSAKQDQVLAALASLAEALSGTLNVAGTVSLDSNAVSVSGHVNVDNAVTVNPGSTFPVSLAGSATESKQDAILTALAGLLTAVQAPQPITDNGGSVTVDGTVGISGTVPVSLTSVPTHAVTQSGTWNVTNTPANAATLTTTPTAIPVGTTSVQLAASVAGRKSVLIQNMGNSTLFVSFAATAVATAPTFVIPANNGAEISRDTWTGVVTAIRASGSTTADAVVTVVS